MGEGVDKRIGPAVRFLIVFATCDAVFFVKRGAYTRTLEPHFMGTPDTPLYEDPPPCVSTKPPGCDPQPVARGPAPVARCVLAEAEEPGALRTRGGVGREGTQQLTTGRRVPGVVF